MSILIKGMEMPKDGVYWCEIGVAGEIAMITIHGEDRKSFPLVPVPPHGKWIPSEDDSKVFGCSECHEIVYGTSNYCPRCGAKMDLVI